MIKLVGVKDKSEGQIKAHDILKRLVDKHTLLALSGGTSVDYRKMLVESTDVIPGAICVVDERYGEEFHRDSNELLLKNQGIKDFADEECIETHKILKGKGFLETAKIYEEEIEDLFKRFKKRVGVMGVGTNLHTAGIFPHSSATQSADYVVAEEVKDKQSLRSSPAKRGAGLKFPKRITLTLKALGEFSSFVILLFGSAKQNTLRMILDKSVNDMQKYPAIFYRKYKAKTYLITDINV